MGRLKILVVDDEYCTRKVIRALLLAMGCTKIREANDGTSGVAAFRSFAPDVVLLDWELPDMSGAEFLQHIGDAGSIGLAYVPVIALTSHDERARVLEAVRLGVHEFLLKPVSSTALKERMRSVLAKLAATNRASRWAPDRRRLAG
jgi:CheY-like chemotaxis protein